jgi:hypothetical protein
VDKNADNTMMLVPVMTAGLVTGQFVIYKWVKELLDAPAGVEIHKGKKN